MKRLTMTAAAIALTAGSAFAASDSASDTKILPDANAETQAEAPMTTSPEAEQNADATGNTDMMPSAESDMAAGDTATAPADTGSEIAGLTEGDMLSSDLVGAGLFTTAVTDDSAGMGTTETDVSMADPQAPGKNIGEISDIVLAKDGQIKGIVADLGGFLGIGSTEVFVPVADYELKPQDDGSFAVVVDYTQEELEGMADTGSMELN